jgi:GAF domain-containing protein
MVQAGYKTHGTNGAGQRSWDQISPQCQREIEVKGMEQKEKKYFEALYDVASVVTSSLEPREVLDRIVRAVTDALGTKACALRVVDKPRQRLMMGACHGLSSGYVRKGPVLVSESGVDREALAGEIVLIDDAQNDSRFQYQGRAKEEGIRSVLVVPLKVEDSTVGVLRVYTDQVRKFEPDEVKFLQAAANLSAIALENARLHAALARDYDLLVKDRDRLDDN